MTTIHQHQALHVVGIELRTSNAEAHRTIPPHWQRFVAEAVLQSIPDRLSDEVYVVYTHYEHAGVDNAGIYSCVIGAAVPPAGVAALAPGLVRVVVPASRRVVLPVPGGRPDRVYETWQASWARQDLARTCIADHEHYRADGGIDLSIGVAA